MSSALSLLEHTVTGNINTIRVKQRDTVRASLRFDCQCRAGVKQKEEEEDEEEEQAKAEHVILIFRRSKGVAHRGEGDRVHAICGC